MIESLEASVDGEQECPLCRVYHLKSQQLQLQLQNSTSIIIALQTALQQSKEQGNACLSTKKQQVTGLSKKILQFSADLLKLHQTSEEGLLEATQAIKGVESRLKVVEKQRDILYRKYVAKTQVLQVAVEQQQELVSLRSRVKKWADERRQMEAVINENVRLEEELIELREARGKEKSIYNPPSWLSSQSDTQSQFMPSMD